MRFRRKTRPKTFGSWTKETSRLAHAAKQRKRLESTREPEPKKVEAGQYLGTLRWYAVDGTVRSWVITQGPRANNIGVVAKLAGSDLVRRFGGFDWLFRCLRKRLALRRVIYE